MPFESNAATDELSSPFFEKNKEICEEFDAFIVSFGGETRGKYNAFSYSGIGKIPHSNKWEFRIAKASFTSGNLILSSKYQNLHHASLWLANVLPSDCPNFMIRKKKWFDSLFISLLNKMNWFGKKHVIKTSNSEHQLIANLKSILSQLFERNEIWKIEYANSILKIETRSEGLNTSIIELLIKEKLLD